MDVRSPVNRVPNNTPINTDTRPEPERKEYTYATLLEDNPEECEAWYYFLRWQGNEQAIKHLENQIDQVKWRGIEGLSVFTIETDYLVSEQTAKEMTKIDMNSQSFHRKFDGTLKMIDFGLKPKYKTEKRMEKFFEKLGHGGIEDYIDKEDIDPEDLDDNESRHGRTPNYSSSSDDSTESGSGSDRSPSPSPERRKKKTGRLPGAVQPIPRVAAARRHRHK